MSRIRGGARAGRGFLAGALALALLWGGPALVGLVFPRGVEEPVGVEHEVVVGPGHPSETLRWAGNVTVDGDRAWMLQPRLPWRFAASPEGPGMFVTFRVFVNGALAHRSDLSIEAGATENQGWPDPRDVWARGREGMEPLLANDGRNEVVYEVRIERYGEGGGEGLAGPLLLGVVPADLDRDRVPDRLQPLPAHSGVVAACGGMVAAVLAARRQDGRASP